MHLGVGRWGCFWWVEWEDPMGWWSSLVAGETSIHAYYMRRRGWGCLGGTRAVCFGNLQTTKTSGKLVPDSWEKITT